MIAIAGFAVGWLLGEMDGAIGAADSEFHRGFVLGKTPQKSWEMRYSSFGRSTQPDYLGVAFLLP